MIYNFLYDNTLSLSHYIIQIELVCVPLWSNYLISGKKIFLR